LVGRQSQLLLPVTFMYLRILQQLKTRVNVTGNQIDHASVRSNHRLDFFFN